MMVGAAAAQTTPTPGRPRRSAADWLDLAFPASLRRVFAALVVLSAASFVVNQGTYAEFTTTVHSPNNTFSTGNLALTTSAGGSALFTVGGLVAGDAVSSTIDVQNAGTIPANTYTMTTSPAAASVLTGDTTHGLQLVVDRCSAAWSAPAPYTCGGTQTRVATGGVVQSNVAMGRMLLGGAVDHLRITVSLPAAAGNSFGSQSASITFRWDAGQ